MSFMENKKVLAITISEQLQKKIKYHLLENNITLKAYVTGLIEENLEKLSKEVEQEIEMAIQKGKRCGLSDEEIRALFELMMEE